MSVTSANSTARFELRSSSPGQYGMVLSGRLDTGSTATVWNRLQDALGRVPVSTLDIDAAGVEYCDGAGVALLHLLMLPPQRHTTIRGLRPEFEKLVQGFSRQDYVKNRAQPPPREPITEQVGRAAAGTMQDLLTEVSFIGELSAGLTASLVRAKAMRLREIARVFEQAGVNALPIVSIISLLVGLIIAFEAAAPFAMFGAQIFIANMLGIIMARELSGLMTAIIVAGRSGSSFAAELGTMKVNEELDALETMGLNPLRFLVVQRVVAGTLLMPLLTIYSMFVSIAGGVLVLMAMGFPLVSIYNQMSQSLHGRDILIGVAKAVIFGVLISGVGCLRGLQTKQGPSAVGESTTRAVVTGILLVIAADALIAIVLYVLKL